VANILDTIKLVDDGMPKYFTVSDALKSLVPGAIFHILNNDLDQLTWYDEESPDDDGVFSPASCPTEAEIKTELEKLKTDYLALLYSRNRARAYPEMGEQLDLLYHAIDAEALDKTSDFYTKLKKVKNDNPKPD